MREAPTAGGGFSRRSFLADLGMGFTGLALGAMLFRDGVARAEGTDAWAPPDGLPHFTPRAKRVIWLFMIGGTSHLESFDPKPELNRHAGKTSAESPHRGVLDSPFTENVRIFATEDDAKAAGLRACKRCRPDLFYKGEDENIALFEGLQGRVRAAPQDFADASALAIVEAARDGVAGIRYGAGRHNNIATASVLAVLSAARRLGVSASDLGRS